MPKKVDLGNKVVAVNVVDDVVMIRIKLSNKYEAQVFYDDIVERIRSGDGVVLGVIPK